jgi:hypothetical protein
MRRARGLKFTRKGRRSGQKGAIAQRSVIQEIPGSDRRHGEGAAMRQSRWPWGLPWRFGSRNRRMDCRVASLLAMTGSEDRGLRTEDSNSCGREAPGNGLSSVLCPLSSDPPRRAVRAMAKGTEFPARSPSHDGSLLLPRHCEGRRPVAIHTALGNGQTLRESEPPLDCRVAALLARTGSEDRRPRTEDSNSCGREAPGN